MYNSNKLPVKSKRKFVQENLIINSWDKIEPFFDDLLNREIVNVKGLEKWLLDKSELEAVLEEEMAWRYIKMKLNTNDEKLSQMFQFWIKEISPKISPYSHKLNLKLIESPYVHHLDKNKYRIFLRSIKKSIDIYRKENIPLFTEMKSKQQEYGSIVAQMNIEVDGELITMQKAEVLLKDINRKKREEIFNKIKNRRLKDEKKLDKLYNELIELRQIISKNAGFENYRDYMFSAMGRFDYTFEDCYDFHKSISQEIVPIITCFEKERKRNLGNDSYKIWDTKVDTNGSSPLNPFNGEKQLTELTIECFNRISPYFGECIAIMQKMKHLDLESKNGKAPGGFMYPLYEIGIPFIYMNAVGSHRDLVTMVHEGGHAIHSFLSRDLELTAFKSTPSEVAELASMSMELISMKYWNVFYTDKKELIRAKKEQLEKVLEGLPWIAAIDKFQHWIYTNTHTSEERKLKWIDINKELGSQIIDWDGQENYHKIIWQKQLHLFEVPFYYIEYGIAQLGAIAIWREFIKDEKKALDNYVKALKLGYTRSISEIYETAGIKFDFSSQYVRELANFIKEELNKIK